ncbi:N-6 DNA methylase [Candidatus Uhrbacteria bacterium]|nr:N-6 DNA methylase [Candidatus Uhrbacteria bacterium]
MPAPQRIVELVDKFKLHFDYYQSSEYNEEQLRTEFLNPFFEVLGWDMENKLAKGADRDVHYEKLVHGKAPDFGFYLDKKIRFFVEAKKPSLNICSNQDAALQLRGYGWSAKTVRSILTDFEEFAIYDTSVRPKNGDTSRIARIDCIKFDEYVDRWDEIVDLFSREKVLGGSLEKLTKKRAQQTVDGELLEDISKWRNLLAHNIANRNEVSEERLNRIVQDTIGRILFLRICEDRGIANEGDLRGVIEGEDNYAKLYKLFKKAEQRYDSDLFEVASIADLKIDDKVLKDVISELYFPKSPYKFDAIPAEILGQVYEQFLGKVIRLTEGGHAKVELKPEVRKAGGIYYTPTYIVEYIVQNTVGKLVEGKTPKQIEKLSIVDPACGSGSFLLGAYKFLADWYRDWYVADDAKKHEKAKKVYRDPAGQWQLTLEERKRVLTAHIYGVDLDRQAVELAKLSLMLEALRSPEQQSLFNDRMLPRLGDNIKCGNSLIASDFSEKPEDLVRVHAFDWAVQFESIIKSGGFDAVIGNPPYLRQESLKESKDYFEKHYESYSGTGDLFTYFMEKGVKLIRPGGRYSIIVSSSFLRATYAEALRETLLKHAALIRIVDFGGLAVFADAKDTYVCIPVLAKEKQSDQVEISKVRTLETDSVLAEMSKTDFFASVKQFNRDAWSLRSGAQLKTFAKIVKAGEPLGSYVNKKIFYGIKTGLNEAFVVTTEQRDRLVAKAEASAVLIHPCRGGEDVREYFIEPTDSWLIVLPAGWTRSQMGKAGASASEVKAWAWLSEEHPSIVSHLEPFTKALRERQDQGDFWWELRPCDYYETFNQPKLLYPDICKHPRFAYDESGIYPTNTIYALGTGDKYLLGILNSRLFWFAISNISIPFGVRAGEFRYRLIYQYMEQIPVRKLDLKKSAEKVMYEKMVDLANRRLAHTRELHESASESGKITLQNAITATDKQIDALVYELYGLTEEEVRIVEEIRG